MNEINQRIKNIRESKHITQEELAKKCHLSSKTIKNYENGKSLPLLNNLILICKALDCSLSYILTGTQNIILDKIQEKTPIVSNFQDELSMKIDQLLKENNSLTEEEILNLINNQVEIKK